jgi:hypothetical protein
MAGRISVYYNDTTMTLAFGLEDVDLSNTSILSEEIRERFWSPSTTNRERLRFAHRVMTRGSIPKAGHEATRATEDARYAFAINWVRKGKMTRLTVHESNVWAYLMNVYDRERRAPAA